MSQTTNVRTVPLSYAQASVEGSWLGFGISTDPAVARQRARGEAIERFGLRRPDLTRHSAVPRMATVEDTPGLMFDYFREVAPPSGRGARHDRFRVSRGITDRGRKRLIPIEWIYLGASPAANTNGAAFGPTLDAAIESARRELIERDLLLRAWYGLASSRELTTRELANPTIARWRSAAQAQGLEARWFLLGRLGALVTIVCVVGADAPPHFGSGSATNPDFVAAAEKAFFEAAGSHLNHVSQSTRLGGRRFIRDARARAAGDPARFKLLTFEAYWAAGMPHAWTAVAERFSRPRVRNPPPLSRRDFLWVDATPSRIGRGRVVKVFHRDAAPLPNCMAHVIALERLLNVRGDGTPPPIS